MLCVVQLAIDLILNKFWIIFHLILHPLLRTLYIMQFSQQKIKARVSHDNSRFVIISFP